MAFGPRARQHITEAFSALIHKNAVELDNAYSSIEDGKFKVSLSLTVEPAKDGEYYDLSISFSTGVKVKDARGVTISETQLQIEEEIENMRKEYLPQAESVSLTVRGKTVALKSKQELDAAWEDTEDEEAAL